MKKVRWRGTPRFVPLESNNHLLLEHELAWPKFLSTVKGFLNEDTGEA